MRHSILRSAIENHPSFATSNGETNDIAKLPPPTIYPANGFAGRGAAIPRQGPTSVATSQVDLDIFD
jgi:hypothetical protein